MQARRLCRTKTITVTCRIVARFTRERLLRCLGTTKAWKIATYADTSFSAGEVTTYVNSACSSAVAMIRAIGSGMVAHLRRCNCRRLGPIADPPNPAQTWRATPTQRYIEADVEAQRKVVDLI